MENTLKQSFADNKTITDTPEGAVSLEKPIP
jgi:hypothetical protein